MLSAFLAISAIKVLLIPAYRSTDFDVHRNWLSITSNLPVSEWYFEQSNSVHTLDYPPLFALFEFSLSKVASLFPHLDDRCLALLPDNDNAPSTECVIFSRSTVIVSDTIFAIACYYSVRSSLSSLPLFLLLFGNAGLLMLDHIHFQYNGMLLGILILSCVCVQNDRVLLGAYLYASLVMMKHLYLPIGLVYFVYLWTHYCGGFGKFNVRFLKLGLVTISGLVMPLLPFLVVGNWRKQLQQILERLFPFGRGLVHAYWAPNVWAIYMAGDRVLNKLVGGGGGGSTDGLVNNVPPAVLPNVSPGMCVALIALCTLPILKKCLNVNKKKVKDNLFLRCVANVAFTTFMLGFHVHEKAIMTSVIIYTILGRESLEDGKMMLRMSVVGHFSLFPLLFERRELGVKVCLWVLHMLVVRSVVADNEKEKEKGWVLVLGVGDRVGLGVLGLVGIWGEFHTLVFGAGKLEFLPLMMSSVVCGGMNVWMWIKSFDF